MTVNNFYKQKKMDGSTKKKRVINIGKISIFNSKYSSILIPATFLLGSIDFFEVNKFSSIF